MTTVTTTPCRANPVLIAVLAGCILLPTASAAVAPRPSAPRQDEDPRAALPAPEAPPELTAAKVQKLGRSIKKLTSKKTKARRLAEADILEFGRGAIPHLVDTSATTSVYKQSSVVRCLIALADMRDWDLVEANLDSEQVALRRFAARKAGELELVHLVDALQPLLEDEDTDVRLEAAVALASLGSEEGLGALAEVYSDIYRVEQAGEPKSGDDAAEAAIDQGVRIRAALAGLAGEGGHSALIARLKSDPKKEKTDPEGAALNRQSAIALLAAIGDSASVRGISKSLDDAHNVVQRDAINALRQLVEEQGPFSGGSIFQQINEVKRLKEVMRQRR